MALSAFLCGLTPASAETTVRVGGCSFPPYSSTSETGVAEEFSIDAIRMLLEPNGYVPSFVAFHNPAELVEALEKGDIDMTSVLANSAARRGEVSGTSPNSSPVSIYGSSVRVR